MVNAIQMQLIIFSGVSVSQVTTHSPSTERN